MTTVLIQKELLNELPLLIEDYNQFHKPKLKLDVAVYFLSLFNSILTQYRIVEKGEYNIEEDDYLDEEEHIVTLNSQKLKKMHSNYNNYIDFLQKTGLIELIKNYSTDTKTSKQYRIKEVNLTKKLSRYTITDKIFLKNFVNGLTEEQLQKKEECLRLRPQLLKFFDSRILHLKTKTTYTF